MNERSPLASAFLADRDIAQAQVDHLEAALAEIVARGEQAWPGLAVDPCAFVGYLRARLPAEGALGPSLESLRVTDLYLALACAGVDREKAIVALESAFFHDCDAALARMAPDVDFIAEVKQRARAKLFVGDATQPPRIVEYAGRGELGAFLRIVIMREAISLQRKERSHPAAHEVPVDPGLGVADPELLYMRRKYASAFESAFRDAVAALTSEERNLLRYHYLDRLNIDHIGAIYSIHRVSAARRLTRIRAQLVEGARGRLADSLRIEGTELRSVLRLIESQVDLSLGRALADASRDG
jgi:RNA polymerase sigma-70 factor (ECF subfamily)